MNTEIFYTLDQQTIYKNYYPIYKEPGLYWHFFIPNSLLEDKNIPDFMYKVNMALLLDLYYYQTNLAEAKKILFWFLDNMHKDKIYPKIFEHLNEAHESILFLDQLNQEFLTHNWSIYYDAPFSPSNLTGYYTFVNALKNNFKLEEIITTDAKIMYKSKIPYRNKQTFFIYDFNYFKHDNRFIGKTQKRYQIFPT